MLTTLAIFSFMNFIYLLKWSYDAETFEGIFKYEAELGAISKQILVSIKNLEAAIGLLLIILILLIIIIMFLWSGQKRIKNEIYTLKKQMESQNELKMESQNELKMESPINSKN